MGTKNDNNKYYIKYTLTHTFDSLGILINAKVLIIESAETTIENERNRENYTYVYVIYLFCNDSTRVSLTS